MDSRELGLVAGQQLTGMEDLHYGLWQAGETPSILGAKAAQERYTQLILDTIVQHGGEPADTKILDVGCGTGVILKRLLGLGYQVDGVIPAAYLKKQVDQRIADLSGAYQPKIYECNFEDFPEVDRNNQYDIVLFSESYQYIPMKASFLLIKHLLKSDGKVVVCDFSRPRTMEMAVPATKVLAVVTRWTSSIVILNTTVTPLCMTTTSPNELVPLSP